MAVNGVDHPAIGDTVESTKVHYALPTLFGCAFLVALIVSFKQRVDSEFDPADATEALDGGNAI